jgi:Mce-associated membrane protein
VAVPSAPDGAVADASTDSATPSSPSSSRSRSALLAAFVLVIVGSLASLGVLLVTSGDAADADADAGGLPQSQREELMSQTQQFVIRVNTYGPSWLDEKNQMPRYVSGVTELMTAKFAASFEQSVVIPESQVAQSGYGRSARVHAVGVASMDADTATVLVGFVRTDSYPKPRDPSKRVKLPGNPERWAVELVRTEGEWLVDNYAVISEIPEDGQPSGAPSGRPSAQPSGPASPGAGGSGGGQQ